MLISTPTLERPDSSVLPPYPVRRWTVDEYRRLSDVGVLTGADRVELLSGWIVPKIPHNPPHDSTVQILTRELYRQIPNDFDLRIQSAINTSDSEPEPDVAIVRGTGADYRDRHPTGGDIVLVIEVADSPLQKDRGKASIYAAAGVETYWIVNIGDRQVEVFESPDTAAQHYASTHIIPSGDPLILQLDESTQIALPSDALFERGETSPS